jgi:hypothetical protein
MTPKLPFQFVCPACKWKAPRRATLAETIKDDDAHECEGE